MAADFSHCCWSNMAAAEATWQRTESASLKLRLESRVAAVATRLTLASDWPTQFLGPSAKGK